MLSFEYVGCFLSFAFAGMMFAFSYATDVRQNLTEINQDMKSKKLRSKVMDQLAELVLFTQLRELS